MVGTKQESFSVGQVGPMKDWTKAEETQAIRQVTFWKSVELGELISKRRDGSQVSGLVIEGMMRIQETE